MDFELEKPQFCGLLFNIEDAFWNKKPLFMIIKEEFSKHVTKLGTSGRIHALGFDELPKTHGESIYQINSFDKTNHQVNLKNSLEILSQYQDEYDVHFILLLDHNFLSKIYQFNKILKIKSNNNYKIQFHFLFFGVSNQKFHKKLKDQNFKFSYLYAQKDLENYLNNLRTNDG